MITWFLWFLALCYGVMAYRQAMILRREKKKLDELGNLVDEAAKYLSELKEEDQKGEK